MNNNIAEDLVPIELDLNAAANGELSESFLGQFGWSVEQILTQLFGGPGVPVIIKGTQPQIQQFANTLQREYEYMSTFKKYGLDDRYALRSKNALDNAVRGFEKETGLKWPFK